MSHTYTYTWVALGVSPSAYAEIRAKLVAAGYQHAIHTKDGQETIDMHGIGLQEDPLGDFAPDTKPTDVS